MSINYNEIGLHIEGPAKSICIQDHGLEGHIQGFNGDFGGDGLTDKHGKHHFANVSISLSNLGHHTKLLARDFIPEMLGWSICNSV